MFEKSLQSSELSPEKADLQSRIAHVETVRQSNIEKHEKMGARLKELLAEDPITEQGKDEVSQINKSWLDTSTAIDENEATIKRLTDELEKVS